MTRGRPLSQKAVVNSVDAYHNVAGLDDRISILTGRELQFIRCFIGDRGRSMCATHVNHDMRGCGALFYIGDFTFELVACAELHRVHPVLHGGVHKCKSSVRNKRIRSLADQLM
jgi:hypothetical protein